MEATSVGIIVCCRNCRFPNGVFKCIEHLSCENQGEFNVLEGRRKCVSCEEIIHFNDLFHFNLEDLVKIEELIKYSCDDCGQDFVLHVEEIDKSKHNEFIECPFCCSN